MKKRKKFVALFLALALSVNALAMPAAAADSAMRKPVRPDVCPL